MAERGIDTLAYRVRAQSVHAQRIAEFLAAHPAVERVHYPGLATHPGHDIAKEQMSGFGGMLSFQVSGCAATAMAVATKARLFTRAASVGGGHSFVEHRA